MNQQTQFENRIDHRHDGEAAPPDRLNEMRDVGTALFRQEVQPGNSGLGEKAGRVGGNVG